jgi:hypothetical protein
MVVPDGYLEVQRLLEAGSPLVFVSGNAGTGKTTLIRYLGRTSTFGVSCSLRPAWRP